MKLQNQTAMKKISLILAILFSLSAYTQEIPHFISYQGKLLENGAPASGTKNMTFSIGDWSDTLDVNVDEGIYTVDLGPIPLEVFDNSPELSLDIIVNGILLEPATDILSVPYSYKSEKSVDTEKINGNIVSGIPSNDQVLKWIGSSWYPAGDNDNQTLSIDEYNLTISEGNTITLPSGPWIQDGENIYYNEGPVLIGTTSGGNTKLKIETGNDNSGFKITNNSDNQVALRIQNNTGAGKPILIENASDNGISITSSGNPTSSVNISDGGTGNALRIDNNSAGGHGLYVINSGSG